MATNIKDLLSKNALPSARGKHFIGTMNNWA